MTRPNPRPSPHPDPHPSPKPNTDPNPAYTPTRRPTWGTAPRRARASSTMRSPTGWRRRRYAQARAGTRRSFCCCRPRTCPRATRRSSHTSATPRRARVAPPPPPPIPPPPPPPPPPPLPLTAAALALASPLPAAVTSLVSPAATRRRARGAGARGALDSGCRRRPAARSRGDSAAALCSCTSGST